ncbi:MAG: thiamine diphosphokinase [Paracoccus sp. (in: a-proteobacteria)]|nr:thiamine diphosphokinase [Paracoccus sp. (in: a-proteobacteria)]
MIQTPFGVTLIGGGASDPADLAAALALAPLLVAADGGADQALAMGHLPELAIGDFDSISAGARMRLGEGRLAHIAEQDSTDFEKALRHIRAGFVLAVGFTGRRLDHTLAALNVMIRHRDRPVILLGGEDITFAAPARLELPVAAGTRLSLFPLGPAQGESEGLRWPIDGIAMTPAGRIGTSNEATGPVSLRMDGPMAVILPRDHLALALRALGVSAQIMNR